MSYGWLLYARYEDGFVLREQPEGISPWGVGDHWTAILKSQAVPFHGKLVAYGIVPEAGGEGFEIDWRTMPEGAEPVYYRKMTAGLVMGGGEVPIECEATCFGYRFVDPDGHLVEEIKELA